MERADVLIVGAGLAGLSVAEQLGGAVTVLEQGAGVGLEASAQNAGMIRVVSEDPFERALAVRSSRIYAEGPLQAHVQRSGAILGLAYDPHHLQDAVAHLRALGVPIDEVADPRELSPVLREARLQKAFWFPEAQVADAAGLVRGLRHAVDAAGGRIRTSTQVTRIVVEGGKVAGVETSLGRIAADVVVLAAGAWSTQLVRDIGLHRPLLAIRRSVMAWDRPGARDGEPWVWLDDAGIYVRPTDGAWLLSPCDEAVDPPQPGPGSTREAVSGTLDLLRDKLARFLPSVQLPGPPDRGWSGLRTFAPDRRPVLGADGEVTGLHWAAGLGGFGVTTAPAVGELVAASIRGVPVPWLDASGVAPRRPYPRRVVVWPSGFVGRGRLVEVPGATEPVGRPTN